MKKNLLWVILALLVVIGGVYWYQKKEKAGSESDVVKIGAILPLTGAISDIGEGERRGIELALQKIRLDNPDLKIKILYEDFGLDPKNAVAAAKKLISIDKVNYLITSTTAAAEAVSPIAFETKIPHFVITPDVEIVKKFHPNNYRIYYNFNQEAYEFVEWIKKENIKNVAIMGVDQSATRNEVEIAIIPELKKLGIKVNVEYFDLKAPEFKNHILKAKSYNPECVFLIPHIFQTKNLIKEMELYGLKPSNNLKIVGSYTFNWSEKSFIETLSGYYIMGPNSETVENINIVNDFLKKYNREPNFDALLAYDNLSILINCVLESKNDEETKFNEVFNSLGKYKGASGEILFIGENETKTNVTISNIQ